MYGGAAEVVGFFQYTAPDATHPTEMIIKNAQYSLALHSELCWTCSGTQFYTTLLAETRGSEIRTMPGGSAANCTYGVYSGYRTSAVDSVTAVLPIEMSKSVRIEAPRISSQKAGVLRIALPSGLRTAEVRVLNLQGQLIGNRAIAAQEAAQVSIDNVKRGTYIVQLVTEKGRVVEKTVIAK